MYRLLVNILMLTSSYSFSTYKLYNFQTKAFNRLRVHSIRSSSSINQRHRTKNNQNSILVGPLLLQPLWTTLIHSQQPSSATTTKRSFYFQNESSSSSLSSAMAKKPKFYAVKKGRKNGIYRTWDECKSQTHGYKGAIFKSFPTMEEAQLFIGNNNNDNSSGRAGGQQNRVNTAGVVEAIHSNTASRQKRTVTPTSATSAKPSSFSLNESLLIEMYFDGGSRGNPGLGGSGAHIIVNNYIFPEINSIPSDRKIRHYCGRCTNNIAEYTGLVEGLKQIDDIVKSFCSELGNRKQSKTSSSQQQKQHVVVKVHGDSNLIINQMNGNYAVKNEDLKKKYNECIDIISSIRQRVASCIDLNVIITFDHVYRDKNTVADSLANEAMDTKQSWISEEDEV